MYTHSNQGNSMSAVMNDWIHRHLITVDEYHRMKEVGILPPDARVELIEGEIIDMEPIGTDHGGATGQLSEILTRAVADFAHVRCQSALRLSDLMEFQPDLVLVRRQADFYKRAPPGPAQTLLVVEVSNTSLRFDTQVKAPLYALHRIPELWIVNLTDHEIQFHRAPQDGKYTEVTTTSTPGIVTPIALPEAHLDLTHLFDN